VGPRTSMDAVVKRKIPYPCQESNPDRPARNLVAMLNELQRLLITGYMRLKNYSAGACYFLLPAPEGSPQRPSSLSLVTENVVCDS
jgi:hypothetical protein